MVVPSRASGRLRGRARFGCSSLITRQYARAGPAAAARSRPLILGRKDEVVSDTAQLPWLCGAWRLRYWPAIRSLHMRSSRGARTNLRHPLLGSSGTGAWLRPSLHAARCSSGPGSGESLRTIRAGATCPGDHARRAVGGHGTRTSAASVGPGMVLSGSRDGARTTRRSAVSSQHGDRR